MELGQLFALISSGQPLTEEQLTQATSLLKGLGSGKVPAGAKSEFGTNYNAFAQALADGLQRAAATPQGKNFVNMVIRERQADRFVRQYKPFLNAVLQGADIVTSLRQIKSANKAVEALQAPGAPSVPQVDPAINEQIANASRGTYDSERALAPARQELRDQYGRDIATARQLSGGQAATFGALANSASLRRMRGATGLPLIADQIKAREQARLDDLLFKRQGLAQTGFENRLGLYDRALDQYNQDVAAAGELGATGQANLRNTLATVPDTLLGVAGRMLPVSNPYSPSGAASRMGGAGANAGQTIGMNPAQRTPMFNQAFSDYGASVEQSLANNLQRLKGIRIPYSANSPLRQYQGSTRLNGQIYQPNTGF